MSELKIVSLFDTHAPFQIPLEPVFEFVEDFRPGVVVLGGDIHDWTAVSSWLSDQSRFLDGGIIKENFQQMEDIVLKPLKKASRGCPVVFLLGNHERRLQRATEINPNGRGYWEFERNVDLKKYNMRVLGYNEAFQPCANLSYIHGIYTNLYHARKTVEAYHTTSVLYGHTHDMQTHTLVSPVSQKHFYKGQSCGCLCTLNPDFLTGRPNKWVNGFNYCYVDQETGHFWDTPVVIVDGEFRTFGRRYK